MNRSSAIAALAAAAVGWAAPCLFAGVAPGNAVDNQSGFTTNAVPRGDDPSSGPITLPFTINFFGGANQLWVNTNGNVTFDQANPSGAPEPLVGSATPIIAPYWADWDTRPADHGQVTYGTGTVNGHSTFGVNWINIGYFDQHTDLTNSLQLLLIDRSDTGAGNFDIEFNYNQVQWETGDNQGGVQGFGGNSARAGYSDGADQSFEFPGSGVNGALLDGGPNALTAGSIGSDIPGRYIFESRDGVIGAASTPGGPPTTGVPLPPAIWSALITLTALTAALRVRRFMGGLTALTCPGDHLT